MSTMAAGCFPLLCLSLAGMVLGGEAANQIAINTVSVDNDNDTLIITVSYTADYQPEVSWVAPTFRQGGGMKNLDFEVEDTLGQGQGQTTFRIKHDVARSQNAKIFNRLLILRNQDCAVEFSFPTFSDLISRAATTQNFDNFALTFITEGSILDPGQDLIFGRYSIQITGMLSSPELSKFDVSNPWVRHTRLKYNSAGIPTKKNYYGYGDENIFEVGDGWSGSNSTKRLPITLYNTYSGILSVYFLRLKQLSNTDSIVSGIEFKQNYYILKNRGDEAVRRNTVYIDTDHSHLLTEFDMPVSLHVPEFSFDAIGNPMPTFSVYRKCSEVSAEEVEVFETRVESKYEVIRFFRFKNATEALAGSYNIVVRSGQMEAREIMSIGVYNSPYG